MEFILPIIGILFVLGWLVLMVWSWFSPAPPSKDPAGDAERDRRIGYLTSLLGSDIESAAHIRYTISRLEEDLGRRATLHEMATAVGVKLESE